MLRAVYHGGLESRPRHRFCCCPVKDPRSSFEWSGCVMRFDKRFCARMTVTASLVAASVSVFGLTPVHAQTTPAFAQATAGQPAMPTTAQQGTVRRMAIDDAVATALEQNLDLQVQRINPELQNLSIAQFKAAY